MGNKTRQSNELKHPRLEYWPGADSRKLNKRSHEQAGNFVKRSKLISAQNCREITGKCEECAMNISLTRHLIAPLLLPHTHFKQYTCDWHRLALGLWWHVLWHVWHEASEASRERGGTRGTLLSSSPMGTSSLAETVAVGNGLQILNYPRFAILPYIYSHII